MNYSSSTVVWTCAVIDVADEEWSGLHDRLAQRNVSAMGLTLFAMLLIVRVRRLETGGLPTACRTARRYYYYGDR